MIKTREKLTNGGRKRDSDGGSKVGYVILGNWWMDDNHECKCEWVVFCSREENGGRRMEYCVFVVVIGNGGKCELEGCDGSERGWW